MFQKGHRVVCILEKDIMLKLGSTPKQHTIMNPLKVFRVHTTIVSPIVPHASIRNMNWVR